MKHYGFQLSIKSVNEIILAILNADTLTVIHYSSTEKCK